MTYHLVPSEINFIQLLDGSIPNEAVVSLTVLASEVILQVPPAEIVTITLETFLIVNSLPFPTSAAVGKVIVEAEDPVKIIYVTLVEDVYVVFELVDVTVPPALLQVATPVASEVKTLPAEAPVVILTVELKVADPVAVTEVNVVAPVTPRVPAIAVLPDAPATVNLFVFTAKSPVMAALARVEAPAVKVEENVPAAALKLPVKLNDVPVAAPMTGVIKVGVLANTNAPVPVSSVIAVAKFALDGVAKYVATFVPNPLTPVEIGKPVPFVKVTEVGTPKVGVTKIGLVDKTKLPEPVELVTPVPPCATSMVVALQIPVVMVPTEVKFDPVTLDFKVVPDKVPASAMIDADPAAVRRPFASTVNVGIAVVDP